MDTFEQRKGDFHELYDFENDPGVTLAHLVRGAGDFLTEIVGHKNAAPAMLIALGPLSFGGDSAVGWRKQLQKNESGAYSDWPMGNLLHDLSAFAQYGIDLDAAANEDEATIENRISQRVAAAEGFLARCPLDAWLGPDRAMQLERTVAMARCRLALDLGQSVDPADLAEIGNISQSRMRSLVSGKTPELKREDGKIPAGIALPWLEKREWFLPSIWRARRPAPDASKGGDEEQLFLEPVFVPRAKDGSIFHPGLKTKNGFQVGPKGNEQKFDSFLEALSELQAMPIPFWRRPSATTGKPGIVRGEDWVRKSAADFI